MAVRRNTVHLGFDAAMRGVVEEIDRVCGQWP